MHTCWKLILHFKIQILYPKIPRSVIGCCAMQTCTLSTYANKIPILTFSELSCILSD